MSNVSICLFRGIKFGSNNKLPMKDITKLLMETWLSDVKTNGENVIYKEDGDECYLDEGDREREIEMYVEHQFGFRPRVLVLSLDNLETVINDNPFRNYEHKGKAQHIFFPFSSTVRADLDSLEALRGPNEAFHLGRHAFYLYAPDGIGRSKLAEKIDHALKTATTARNLNTVETLRDMAAEFTS